MLVLLDAPALEAAVLIQALSHLLMSSSRRVHILEQETSAVPVVSTV